MKYNAGKLVSIFVCGVQKGGTTSLFAYLSEHPALSTSNRKETHFFDDEKQDWSNPTYEELDECFEDVNDSRYRVDVTPIYSFWRPSLQRIHSYNAAAKLIFIFRDPFDRAYSQWCMEFARKEETLPFAEAIREGRSRIDGLSAEAPERRVYSYIERGLYACQVGRALSLFPREQLLFLRSEDLSDDHVSTLARVADFLHIDPFPEMGPKRENARPEIDVSQPTDADRQFVSDIVRDDMREFASLTGLDVSGWKTVQLQLGARPMRQRRSINDRRPNVLFIVADDLNSWIGALGTQPNVRTPSIDKLALRGTLFARAYCSAPYCNASRMAMFTGCLPSTTGIYANEQYWESTNRRKTYIEAFKEAGYYTHGAGKVFHGAYNYAHAGNSRATEAEWVDIENRLDLWDRFDTSPSEPLPRARPLNGLFNFDNFENVPPFYHHFDWGPLPDEAEAFLPDELVYRSISDFLLDNPREPFFCAAGLYKPHLPWHVPQRFFDLYDRELITLPVVRDDDLDDVPPIARAWALSPADHELVTSRGQWRDAVHGYLAAISYCDWMVGRMLEALDRSGLAKDTIIVLCGDNGFHLGEKLHWRKFVLWEEATRVPLIIAPSHEVQVQPRYDDPVGLVDIFPTLAELCGISGPKAPDGQSLINSMTRGSWPSRPILTTWGKGNHSVRHGNWRYTRYADGSEELYNHISDPKEWNNLSGDPRYSGRVDSMKRFIRVDRVT